MTECNASPMEFEGIGNRRVTGAFDGGRITSDAGILLMREAGERSGLLRRFAFCFTDHRDADLIEHTVESLISQRVYGLACGYEDLNDHDTLRDDPLLAVASGKMDPLSRATRSGAGPGPRAGGQEHAEPAGTHAFGRGRVVALQEDSLSSGPDRGVLRGCVSGCARATA